MGENITLITKKTPMELTSGVNITSLIISIEEINKENENELESLEFSVNREEGRDLNPTNDNPYVSVEAASTGLNSYNHNSKNKISSHQFNTEKHSIEHNESGMSKVIFSSSKSPLL
jgi:hypothetical protein